MMKDSTVEIETAIVPEIFVFPIASIIATTSVVAAPTTLPTRKRYRWSVCRAQQLVLLQ